MISLKTKYVEIIIAAKDRMVRVGDWKLTYQPLQDSAIYQLFNIREDPGCQRDVIDQHPRTAETLRSLLDRWMDEDPRSVGSGGPEQLRRHDPLNRTMSRGLPQ